MKSQKSKPRAIQGELRKLRYESRNELLTWFRDENGTLPYREIARRLKETFDISASPSTLSKYYHDNYTEIVGTSKHEAGMAAPQAIVIRVEIPPGFRVDVSTEASNSDGGAQTS